MTEKEFTEGQEAIIEKLAWAVGDKVTKDLKDHFATAIRVNCSECEIRQEAAKAKGALWVVRFLWGGLGGAAVFLLGKFLK